MITYIITLGSMVIAFVICVLSFMVANQRLRMMAKKQNKRDVEAPESDDTDSKDFLESEKSEEKISFKESVHQAFSVSPISRSIVLAVSICLVGITVFCAQHFVWGEYALDTIGLTKVSVTVLLMMSAAVIDFYTKKIPNFLPLTFLVVGVVVLIAEFIFMRESFVILLVGSLLGLIGGFLILVLMSLITKGGIGMGDVKLISTMGFLSGISASFYSFFFATVLCLIVSLVLLILKLKKIKDELPFGPFLFLGYVLTVIIGNF